MRLPIPVRRDRGLAWNALLGDLSDGKVLEGRSDQNAFNGHIR